MKRGVGELSVEASGGVVVITATMPGNEAVMRVPWEMVNKLCIKLMLEADVAEKQVIDG
ncbi:MAG: hypothetical protein AAGI03_00565 [Pseudomonadota bacterium]